MLQYDSKSNTQTEKTKAYTPIANKSNVQAETKMPVRTKNLFSFSGSLENRVEQKEERKQFELAPIKPNNTGIPTPMKSRFEVLSGFSFDDVKVHYDSGKPAQLQALAYTQENQVYIAPGQEKYLPHELGHVVQQKQGRVKPTMQLNSVPVNDDKGLEKEADTVERNAKKIPVSRPAAVAQRFLYINDPDYKKGIQIDYKKITDLGTWWAMACEWHEQKAQSLAGKDARTSPEDCFASMQAILDGGAHKIKSSDLKTDENVGIYTHGNSEGEIDVTGYTVKSMMDVINSLRKNNDLPINKINPSHCYMGKPGTAGTEKLDKTITGGTGGTLSQLGRSGLADGPTIRTEDKIYSINISKLSDATEDFKDSSGTAWIKKSGGWNNDIIPSTAIEQYVSGTKTLQETLETIYPLIKESMDKFYHHLNTISAINGQMDRKKAYN